MVILVVPTYNESGSIELLVEQVSLTLGEADCTFVIVDDSSEDGTIEIIRKLQAKYNIKLLIRSSKKGLGGALKLGMRAAISSKPEFIITMDADLSHDPKVLPQLISKAKTADLVLGSRYVRGGSFESSTDRFLLSRCGNILAKALLSLPVQDLTTGFRCYNPALLETISLDSIKSENYSFELEILWALHNAKAVIAEIPIKFSPRMYNKSKFRAGEIVGSAYTLFRLLAQKYFKVSA